VALNTDVAGAGSESYISVAEADAFAAGDLPGDPEVARWTAAATTVAEKEAALRGATSRIDAAVHTGYASYDLAQVLVFPRSIDWNGSGPLIPGAVKRATYEQAKYELKNAAVLAAARTRQGRDMQSANEPNFGYTQSDERNELSPRAMHYLSIFVSSTGRGLRSYVVAAGVAG
jgi:hypothetical protein